MLSSRPASSAPTASTRARHVREVERDEGALLIEILADQRQAYRGLKTVPLQRRDLLCGTRRGGNSQDTLDTR